MTDGLGHIVTQVRMVTGPKVDYNAPGPATWSGAYGQSLPGRAAPNLQAFLVGAARGSMA